MAVTKAAVEVEAETEMSAVQAAAAAAAGTAEVGQVAAEQAAAEDIAAEQAEAEQMVAGAAEVSAEAVAAEAAAARSDEHESDNVLTSTMTPIKATDINEECCVVCMDEPRTHIFGLQPQNSPTEPYRRGGNKECIV